jgi:hypothetical protein
VNSRVFRCAVVTDVVEEYDPDEDAYTVKENTVDWYAQDDEGNVWYFGEIAQNFEDGELVDVEGSWKAGRDGAKPGIIMYHYPDTSAEPPQRVYRQEFLLGDAEDIGEFVGFLETLEVRGLVYSDVLKTKDYTPIESEVFEYKYYAPGVGDALALAVHSTFETRGSRTVRSSQVGHRQHKARGEQQPQHLLHHNALGGIGAEHDRENGQIDQLIHGALSVCAPSPQAAPDRGQYAGEPRDPAEGSAAEPDHPERHPEKTPGQKGPGAMPCDRTAQGEAGLNLPDDRAGSDQTSAAATPGFTTCSQRASAVKPVPNPASPLTNPPQKAPKTNTVVVITFETSGDPGRSIPRDAHWFMASGSSRRILPGNAQGKRARWRHSSTAAD